VVGARPNFPKIAPIMAAMARQPQRWSQRLVHTGQHYDERMSALLFHDLELPEPDEYLGVGSGSHAQQTARVMLAFEPVVLRERPDWVLVVGDVNSTVACALVCAKLGVPVAHVEAGLRSGDRTMPEEINRIVTDQLAELLFTHSPDADRNLLREGVAAERIVRAGNVMIDSLVAALPAAERSDVLERLGLAHRAYGVVTLHRPSNVDDDASLGRIAGALGEVAQELPLVWPLHPRAAERIRMLAGARPGLRLIEPQGYIDFVRLTRDARLVLTDSGGLQEESSWLGVPCLTLRPNTERPITIERGTNVLVGSEPDAIVRAARRALGQPMPEPAAIEGWDGHAAERIVSALWSKGD